MCLDLTLVSAEIAGWLAGFPFLLPAHCPLECVKVRISFALLPEPENCVLHLLYLVRWNNFILSDLLLRSHFEWSVVSQNHVHVRVCAEFLWVMFSVLLCRCRIKTRKRHRYSLLREVEDDDDKDKLELMPKGEFTGADVKFFLYECVLFFSGLTKK